MGVDQAGIAAAFIDRSPRQRQDTQSQISHHLAQSEKQEELAFVGPGLDLVGRVSPS